MQRAALSSRQRGSVFHHEQPIAEMKNAYATLDQIISRDHGRSLFASYTELKCFYFRH
jgi:hypothetical protein